MAKRRHNPVGRKLRRTKQALADAMKALAVIGTLVRGRGKANARSSKVTRRRRLSPKRLTQLKLHGTYIGHLRHLKPRQRAQVKAVKAKKGYEAAIRTAKRVATQ